VSPIEKADVLLEALPYIRRFAGKVMVVKYGGHAMEDDRAQGLLRAGRRAAEVRRDEPRDRPRRRAADRRLRCQKAGIVPRFVRGLRVTDAATMDIVEMVLVGKVNKEIVTLLNRHGGLGRRPLGKDGELVVARKRRTGDLGLVGDVVGVNARVIESLQGFVPVIAPVAADTDGVTYNINADVVAGKIAEALRAEKLILLTDVEGVKGSDGALIDTLPPTSRTT
jgi:acetylglutamate kinase